MAAKNDYILYDEHLGNLKIHINQRSRHTIFRTKDDGVHITVPPFVEEKRIRELVGEFRLRLEAAMKEVKRPLIDLNFQLETDCVKLRLRQGEYDRFGVEYEQDRIWIVCPSAVQFADETLQQWLHKVIEEILRKKAKELLPARLHLLARRHGLSFRQVKINASRGRWGSCSVHGDINLSFFLLLLPMHLIDYVLLHELTHTLEMNHSDSFWGKLNLFTQGRAVELRDELKHYQTDF